jgi:two-component system sensor histidine kinase UhpB
VAALTNLIERLSARTGLVIERVLERDLPPLAPDAELVIYRVAQESLTNVIRHADAGCAEVTLGQVPGGVVLAVRDDGRGIEPEPASPGGLRFMRERAISVGADLQITARGTNGGAEIRLRVPTEGTAR